MKILLSVFLFSVSHLAYAEYNGWFLKLAIETAKGEVIIGHVYRASAYFKEDSLTNERYVTHALTRSFSQDESLVFYKTLFRYDYVPLGGVEKSYIYTLLNKQSIAITEIKSINVLERYDFWYLENIESAHTTSDTVWMKKPPVAKAIADGYLCSWQIFVHEESANTKKVLAELKANNLKNKKRVEELEEELSYGDYVHKEKIKAQIDEFQDTLEEVASDILAKLNGEKVVIISFCSC